MKELYGKKVNLRYGTGYSQALFSFLNQYHNAKIIYVRRNITEVIASMTARERSKSDFDIKNRKHKKSTFEKRSTFEFIYHAVVQQSEATCKQNPKNVLNLDFLDHFTILLKLIK